MRQTDRLCLCLQVAAVTVITKRAYDMYVQYQFIPEQQNADVGSCKPITSHNGVTLLGLLIQDFISLLQTRRLEQYAGDRFSHAFLKTK